MYHPFFEGGISYPLSSFSSSAWMVFREGGGYNEGGILIFVLGGWWRDEMNHVDVDLIFILVLCERCVCAYFLECM